MRELFAAEADGVHGKATIAQGLQRVRADSRSTHAGHVLSAIAKQHDCAHRQVRGFCDELLESIVDTGGGSRRRDSPCAVYALDVGVEAIETRLEPILEAGEDPAIEGCECGVFARTAVDVTAWPCCANRQRRRR